MRTSQAGGGDRTVRRGDGTNHGTGQEVVRMDYKELFINMLQP